MTRALDLVPHLAQSGVLHCDLAEEKVHVVAVLDGVEEMGLCGRRGEKTCDKHAGGDALLPARRRVESTAGKHRCSSLETADRGTQGESVVKLNLNIRTEA